MTGETKETLKPGRPVQATVRYVNENFARVTLDDLGGLEATLEADKLSASGPVNPMDRVRVGMTLTSECALLSPPAFHFCLSLGSLQSPSL